MAGDFGGVWYWNRFPGIQCDNDAYCYIPLLEELDFMPSKKFADGAEIFEHCKRHRKALRPVRRRAVLHPGARRCAGTRRSSAGGCSTNRGDDIRARFVVMAAGLLQPAEAARHPRDQGLQGSHLPLGALGLRLHRRRRQRWTAQAGRQARRARRHRRDGRAAGAAPGPRRQASLRLSAHAVVGRHARQRADRSGVGGVAAAGLAGGAQAQLPSLVTVRGCGLRRRRPGRATSGPSWAATRRRGSRPARIRHR